MTQTLTAGEKLVWSQRDVSILFNCSCFLYWSQWIQISCDSWLTSGSSLGRFPLSQSGCDHAPVWEGLREVVLVLSRSRPNGLSDRNSAAPPDLSSCVCSTSRPDSAPGLLVTPAGLLIVTGPPETRAPSTHLQLSRFISLRTWEDDKADFSLIVVPWRGFSIVSKYLWFPVNWFDWFERVLQPVPPQRILTCTTPTEWPEHRVPMNASPTVAPSKSIPLKNKERPTWETQVLTNSRFTTFSLKSQKVSQRPILILVLIQVCYEAAGFRGDIVSLTSHFVLIIWIKLAPPENQTWRSNRTWYGLVSPGRFIPPGTDIQYQVWSRLTASFPGRELWERDCSSTVRQTRFSLKHKQTFVCGRSSSVMWKKNLQRLFLVHDLNLWNTTYCAFF